MKVAQFSSVTLALSQFVVGQFRTNHITRHKKFQLYEKLQELRLVLSLLAQYIFNLHSIYIKPTFNILELHSVYCCIHLIKGKSTFTPKMYFPFNMY